MKKDLKAMRKEIIEIFKKYDQQGIGIHATTFPDIVLFTTGISEEITINIMKEIITEYGEKIESLQKQ